MALGYPKDQSSLNSIVGDLAQQVNRQFRRSRQLKAELDTYSDAALTAAGYSSGEITALRALANDLVQLATIYEGSANLSQAKDFRVSLRPVWGILGDI